MSLAHNVQRIALKSQLARLEKEHSPHAHKGNNREMRTPAGGIVYGCRPMDEAVEKDTLSNRYRTVHLPDETTGRWEWLVMLLCDARFWSDSDNPTMCLWSFYSHSQLPLHPSKFRDDRGA